MSFSDMMSSARGPGFIGMLFALIVLAGFAVLFMFAMEESGPSGMTLEQHTRSQAKEIAALDSTIASYQKKLAGAEALERMQGELKSLAHTNTMLKGQLDGLNNEVAGLEEEIGGINTAFAAYKDEYRAFARKAAKGVKLPEVVLKSGEKFTNAIIGEVTPVGMQIRHEGGFKRVTFENLPDDLQDRFQFDPTQKAAALAAEAAARKAHDSEVAAVHEAARGRAEMAKVRDLAEAKARARVEADSASRRIEHLSKEIEALTESLQSEQRKGISRAPQIQRTIANKRGEISELHRRVSSLRSQL